MFLMGSGLQTLVRARQATTGHLKPMHDMQFESLNVEMMGMPEDTFLFH